MKKFLLASTLSASLALAGCASTGGTFDLNAFYAQVQTYVVGACKFEPTFLSIASVVASFFPGGAPVAGGVKMVGDAICASFGTSASASFAAAKPVPGAPATVVVRTPRGNVIVKGTVK